MALTRGFKPAYVMGLTVIPTETIAEGASQTFLKGEVLVASSGYAVVGTGAASDDQPTLATILGVAAEPGRNAAAGLYNVTYTPALPNVVFEGQLMFDAGTALAQAHVGAVYGIDVTSNKWFVEGDETTDERVRVIGLKDAIGTVDGVVYFVFLPNTTIFSSTAAN